MKTMFGLSPKTIDQICSVLSSFETVEKALVYGSRAKGNFREGSDIDLTLFGQINTKTLANISDLGISYLNFECVS